MSEPLHAVNKHHFWDLECASSVIRGARNGVIIGARVRIPYLWQAIAYTFLYPAEGAFLDRVKFVLKQMLFHGRNLAMFVAIYKAICCVFRNLNLAGGGESLLAGFIGGYFAFGDSTGVSGSVNHQIVLYLLARAIYGLTQVAARRGLIPKVADPTLPRGWRIFAGITLALILYLTEYRPELLKENFMGTMNFLYQHSDSGPFVAKDHRNFWPFMILVALSLIGYKWPKFGMDNITTTLLG